MLSPLAEYGLNQQTFRGSGRNRTYNLAIRSRSLYPLSYVPVGAAGLEPATEGL